MAKKSKVDFGKGFKRIYFALSGLWYLLPLGAIYYKNAAGLTLFEYLIFFAAPVVIYYILLFFIKGFKK